MRKTKILKVCLAGVFATLATLTFMLENLFPPIILPGARMGLSHVFILLSVLLLGPWHGICVLLIKTLVGSLFSGNLSAIMYSIPSGLISLAIEIILIYYAKKTSLLSISVFGAVLNIIIQTAIFCLVTNTLEFLVFIPYLTIISAVSGLLVGFILYLIMKKLPEKYLTGV